MIHSVDVLMPNISLYSVLHHFSTKLREALTRAGIQGRLLSGPPTFKQLMDAPPDFTIAFNGAPRTPMDELSFDLIRRPHISLLLDPPFRYSYLYNSPYSIVGCDDRSGTRFLNSHGFKRNFFLPHAVEPELIRSHPEKKTFDLALIATFIDIDERKKKWPSKFSPAICKKLDEAIEILLSDPKSSIPESYPLENTGMDIPQIEIFALQELELYLKGKERIELVKSITDIPLHIFGGSIDKQTWKGYFSKQKNVRTYPDLKFPQAIEVMKQSRILLNSSLKNREGAHERIFYGLACGAMVVTNDSIYVRETFGENDGLIFHSIQNPTLLQNRILLFLKDENRRMSEVVKGQNIVSKSHTWDCRVKEILKTMKQHSQALSK